MPKIGGSKPAAEFAMFHHSKMFPSKLPEAEAKAPAEMLMVDTMKQLAFPYALMKVATQNTVRPSSFAGAVTAPCPSFAILRRNLVSMISSKSPTHQRIACADVEIQEWRSLRFLLVKLELVLLCRGPDLSSTINSGFTKIQSCSVFFQTHNFYSI